MQDPSILYINVTYVFDMYVICTFDVNTYSLYNRYITGKNYNNIEWVD